MLGQNNSGAKTPLSLSSLQQLIGNAVRQSPELQGAWVIAELSDVRAVGGHCYMELIEKDERSGELRAKLRAVIWHSDYVRIGNEFYGATGMVIKTGLKVLVRGNAVHHGVHGLSFNITDIDSGYTLGDMERQRREILDRLQKEGKLNLNKRYRQEFPATPQKIAVISASGAAGYGDFIDHLINTQEGIKFYPLLFNAIMQGERTARSVISALERVEQSIDFWDCVVIIRGGGATTDLNGFNNYELAERIATFPLPVVVGIGHERDRTVLDEIACIRCKTPTAVADFLVDRCRKAWSITVERTKNIADYTLAGLRGEEMRLSHAENLLPTRIKGIIMQAGKALGEMSFRIERMATGVLRKEDNKRELMELRLQNALRNTVEKQKQKLDMCEKMLKALSPENTLKRGYSITRHAGKGVYDAACLKKGDEIITEFAAGKVVSTVK